MHRSGSARGALVAVTGAIVLTLGLTGCADEAADAQSAARSGVRLVWSRTAATMNGIPLAAGTPSRAALLRAGVPALAPRPGTRSAALGSGALALTTRLVRGERSFTVDLFLRADASSGSGDLAKQRSAYACIRVTVTRTSSRLEPEQLPCRRDLLATRDPGTARRVGAAELDAASPTAGP